MVAQQAPQGKPFPLLAREGRLGASVAKAGPHSHPDGRISSINRLFAASNGLTNLTPASSKPSWRSSVSRWRTPARLYRVTITLHLEPGIAVLRTLREDGQTSQQSGPRKSVRQPESKSADT